MRWGNDIQSFYCKGWINITVLGNNTQILHQLYWTDENCIKRKLETNRLKSQIGCTCKTKKTRTVKSIITATHYPSGTTYRNTIITGRLWSLNKTSA